MKATLGVKLLRSFHTASAKSSRWHNLNALFNYPQDIRKAIYTTNAIESLNSVIRKAIKKRKLFPTDDSAKKVIYLAIRDASKRWTMPIHNWKPALNRFMIEFEDRLVDYISTWQLHRNIYSLFRYRCFQVIDSQSRSC